MGCVIYSTMRWDNPLSFWTRVVPDPMSLSNFDLLISIFRENNGLLIENCLIDCICTFIYSYHLINTVWKSNCTTNHRCKQCNQTLFFMLFLWVRCLLTLFLSLSAFIPSCKKSNLRLMVVTHSLPSFIKWIILWSLFPLKNIFQKVFIMNPYWNNNVARQPRGAFVLEVWPCLVGLIYQLNVKNKNLTLLGCLQSLPSR